MKISKLLATHHALIKQARLANQAQAYVTLRRCAERVHRARLCGLVNLRQPNAELGRLWASLTALEGNQSVLEEHFSDEDLMEFADTVAFARGVTNLDITFRLETLTAEFVLPLETELTQAGVVLDLEPDKSSGHGHTTLPQIPDNRRGRAPNQR